MGLRDQGVRQAHFPLDDSRPYWPDGVKLDSKIGDDDRPRVIWVLRWDTTDFYAADYYAHDLYMNKDGGTFISMDDLLIESNLPLTQRYRTDDGSNVLRLGWASYRPAEIQANTTYTVTFISNPTGTYIDDFTEDVETYGIRIPPTCIRNCLWVPLSWCSEAPGGNTIRLFNNSNPDGILPLGVPQGGCNTLLFLPSIWQ